MMMMTAMLVVIIYWPVVSDGDDVDDLMAGWLRWAG